MPFSSACRATLARCHPRAPAIVRWVSSCRRAQFNVGARLVDNGLPYVCGFSDAGGTLAFGIGDLCGRPVHDRLG
jgi:hypothetical protein